MQEEEIVNNIIHCFQTRLKVDDIIAKLPKTSQQVAKLGMIAELQKDKPDGKTINFLFAVKHFNRGKIDSHLNFFRGFCQALQPEFCLLLDIGTEALPQSINKLCSLM